MTTNFEEFAGLPLSLHGVLIVLYWYLWANLYASLTRDRLWCLPINWWLLGGVLNFML